MIFFFGDELFFLNMVIGGWDGWWWVRRQLGWAGVGGGGPGGGNKARQGSISINKTHVLSLAVVGRGRRGHFWATCCSLDYLLPRSLSAGEDFCPILTLSCLCNAVLRSHLHNAQKIQFEKHDVKKHIQQQVS